jgi:c-di-GMP-binding flagellar brake protein YcgR
MQSLFQFMQAISLEVDSGIDAGAYPSLVLDFEDEKQVTVGVPLDRGREVWLSPDTPVRIQLTRPDGIYVFPTRVIGRSADHPSLVLAWPDTSDQVQRRNHVRVGITVPVRLVLRDTEEGETREIAGLSTDFSVGGARLVSTAPIQPGTQVRATVLLADDLEVICEAEVLRGGGEADPERNYPFWQALQFAGMLESVRKEVVQFIFQVQRDLRRKGLT